MTPPLRDPRPARSAPGDLILLDFDGTLADSAPGILSSLRAAFAVAHVDEPDEATLATFLGPPIAHSLARIGLHGGTAQAIIAAYREHYRDVGMADTTVFPGIPDALRTLATGSPGSRLAVATSKPEWYAQRIAAAVGLEPLLDAIYGASLDGTRITKADVIARALDHEPRAVRTIMVGDREHDVTGARAHGIETVGVLWGYGSADELRAAGACALANAPAELPDAVGRALDHRIGQSGAGTAAREARESANGA
ncbi:HAD hydrolase-like protein [Rarobacter incanus]|uniref:Phosphoglycolate phosphatase n=1 Tax=Rarobacter incanus TaxID=153494 RepID=A0A542SS61_9MICO|nr:HAD hydrolase-like protein [Rarobacter incanus]TQK77107.1 phosphoglycolate phosphatase [Rarobacter incanus]